MKVVITVPAKNELRRIYEYFRRKDLGNKGRDIRKNVVEKALLLKDTPYLGQEEEHLKHLNKGHRYLLVPPSYKIIYLVSESTVYITDVFDTRQNPEKMKP